MSDTIVPVPADWAARRRGDPAGDYERSLADPDAFWRDSVARLDWITMPTKMDESSFDEASFGIRWFADGVLNISVNCIDRHLATHADQTAIIWEPDEPSEEPKRFTYRQLHDEVCRFANILKSVGAKKGDRVTLYLPMIPEAAFAMLACARIGAIHSVVFAGFSQMHWLAA